MTQNNQEEKREQDENIHGLNATTLGPVMFYLAGRLDAADRKATLYGTAAIAFLAYIEKQQPFSFSTFKVCDWANLPPLLSILGIFLAACALFPRHVESTCWVTSIFTGRSQPDKILASEMSDPQKTLAGLIQAQTNIAKLARRKNELAKYAMGSLTLSFIAFLAISGATPHS